MRKIIEIRVNDIKLRKDDVLKVQGIPPTKKLPDKIESVFNEALELFIEFSHPIGIISEISIPEFEIVYLGEGFNERVTPLDEIFREAESLALFAITVGEQVNMKIYELFEKNDFALGSMLDSTASDGVEGAADILEDHFFKYLLKKDEFSLSRGLLRYSPGYCGWHMSGQKKLFEFLHPEDIGISLLDSYLMKPLKSISGVIVAGEKEIHIFKDTYPFCNQCKTHSCRERIRVFFRELESNNK